MVLYLKQLPQFKNINGVLLSDLFDKISPIDLVLGEKISVESKTQFSPILIVALGSVKLKEGDSIITELKAGSVYGDIFQNGQVRNVTTLEANERSIVFKIDLADFYFVMANHHELVEGLIKNVTQLNPQPIQ
jgi:hypothetical protein